MTDDSDRMNKSITLASVNGGVKWSAEFSGVVTRRDIAKLSRILSVEFAKHERRRSTARKMTAQKDAVTVKEPTNVIENPNHMERPTNG